MARLAALLTLAALALAPAIQAAPLAAYGRLPHLENLALSPDGTRVALVNTEGDARTAVVVQLGQNHVLGGMRLGDQKVRGIRWADNDRLMIVTSVTTVPRGFIGEIAEWFQMQVYDLKTHKSFLVPGDPREGTFSDVEVMNIIAGREMVRHVGDHTMLFVPGLQLTREGALVTALFRVDLETHATRILRPARDGNLAWVVDDAGEVVAETTYTERDQPHGGPQGRDTADFNWWAQALADQGYAVLQPNFRGSALSWEFVSKGFGEWGRKMQTDLSDGVRYLAGEGTADPRRVCIVGASYGGYAALAGPALDPGVYRCAVAVAGIGDLRRMLKSERRDSSSQRYWSRFMGVSGPNDPALDAISPMGHVSAITVPILLIHGRDDTVVPFEQSQVMYDAMRGAHKDVELVTLKKEDHWLSRSETRLQMLESSVAFLRKHNPPD